VALKAGIKVDGLVELQRDLKQLDPELAKSLKAELKDVAEDVLHDAQNDMPVKSARALQSMKAGADVKGPYVSGGKRSVPYYGWLDFGSRTPIRGRPRSVGPWKGSGAGPKKGRFLFPAIDRNRENITRRAVAAFQKAKKQAFKSPLP
jgi:hypothetical protein